MELNKQIEVRRRIKKLFDEGINRDNVYDLIEKIVEETKEEKQPTVKEFADEVIKFINSKK